MAYCPECVEQGFSRMAPLPSADRYFAKTELQTKYLLIHNIRYPLQFIGVIPLKSLEGKKRWTDFKGCLLLNLNLS